MFFKYFSYANNNGMCKWDLIFLNIFFIQNIIKRKIFDFRNFEKKSSTLFLQKKYSYSKKCVSQKMKASLSVSCYPEPFVRIRFSLKFITSWSNNKKSQMKFMDCFCNVLKRDKLIVVKQGVNSSLTIYSLCNPLKLKTIKGFCQWNCFEK